MQARPTPRPVAVAVARDGTCGYDVDCPASALPPVRARDLEAAWDAARENATHSRWGVPRLFRFRGAGNAAPTQLALADPDACCWADAVDRTLGLASAYGVSVCLRLLALVDVLAQATWAGRFCALRRDGAAIEPQLWRAAAHLPLTDHGTLDPALLHERLRPALPSGAVP